MQWYWDASAQMLTAISEMFKKCLYRSLQTLRRWALNIKVELDILNAIIHCMKFKGRNMQKHEKLIIFTFDEVYLCNKVDIDRKLEQIVGPHKVS